MKTKTEAILTAMERRGWREVPNFKSRKYRLFQSKAGNFYLVGKAGAVRFNSTPKVQGSIPVTDAFKDKLVQEGLG